jgi:hypothetical protein
VLHNQYALLVMTWNGSNLNADGATLNDIVNAVDKYLIKDEIFDLEVAEDQAAKDLVSCLRKRINKGTANCYVLREREIAKHSIEEAMSVTGKLQLLSFIDVNFWSSYAANVMREAKESFQHVVDWGTVLLRDCLLDSEPVEPRNPVLEDKSALHQGIFDWIFVRLTGAFQKN